MSRRRAADKREVLPDAKFGDLVVTKFMNCLMYAGQEVGRRDDRLRRLRPHRQDARARTRCSVFHDALDNVKPAVEVRSRRVGGATYQVPVEVRPERGQALAIRWLIGSVARPLRAHDGRAAVGRTARRRQQSRHAVKKREDTHRMADANKAFSHYRW